MTSKNVTDLIVAWGNGDSDALQQLIPLVHDELRRLASRHMRRENAGNTLQTTALVNEAYCKLVNQKNTHWKNRAQFFAVAAQIMRRILIDHARKHLGVKRGGRARMLPFDDNIFVPLQQARELISLDAALTSLSKLDPKKSRIVELKFFGGLTTDEIAEVEKMSKRSVEREWQKAKLWLHQMLQE